jgi:hypothetical protein
VGLTVATRNSSTVRWAAIAFCATACVVSCGVAHAKIKVIAFEDSVTGPNGDILTIDHGLINHSGRVMFIGRDSDVNEALGVALPEAASFVVREEEHAPGTAAGVMFNTIDDDPHWNSLGQIAFRGELSGPGANSTNRGGLWAGAPGDFRLIAREGDLLPGSEAARIDFVAGDFELGGNGYAMFTAELTDFRVGVWAGTQGNLQAVAIDGQPAAGFPGMTYYLGNIYDDGLSLNHSNRLAFTAVAEAELNFYDAVWTGTPGNLQVVAHSDMAAPGFVAGSKMLYLIDPPRINESNEVAFTAGVEEPDNGIVWSTLYRYSDSGVTRMFNPKATPPGFASGDEFSQVLEYQFADNGNAVMLNPVYHSDGESTDALFAIEDGGVRLVAKVGEQIPNAAGDLYFEYFNQFHMNDAGKIAFLADVGGDEVQTGIWIDDGAGELLEIARIGAPLEIAPGDVRMVEGVSMVGGGFDDPERSPFNYAGQLVFVAEFEDSRALLLYSPAGTPGDYNGDSKVDAADYVVWRNHLGMDVTLPNDETPGTVRDSDYGVWKSHFGQGGGGGSITRLGETAQVPEPGTALILVFCASAIGLRRVGRR